MRCIEIAALAACLGLFGGLPAAHAAGHEIIGAQLSGKSGQPRARIVPKDPTGKKGGIMVLDLRDAQYHKATAVNINLNNHTKRQRAFAARDGAFSGTHDFQRVNLRSGGRTIVISAHDMSTMGEAVPGPEHTMMVIGTSNVDVIGTGYVAKAPFRRGVQPGYGLVGLTLTDPTTAGRVIVAPAGHRGVPDMAKARVIELAPPPRQ